MIPSPNLYVVDVYALLPSGEGRRSTSIHMDTGKAIEAYDAAIAPPSAILTNVRLVEVDGKTDATKLPTVPEAWFIDQPGVTVRRHKTILDTGEVQPSIYDYLNKDWPKVSTVAK